MFPSTVVRGYENKTKTVMRRKFVKQIYCKNLLHSQHNVKHSFLIHFDCPSVLPLSYVRNMIREGMGSRGQMGCNVIASFILLGKMRIWCNLQVLIYPNFLQDVVTEIWNKLLDGGHLYRDDYSSWYSVQVYP